MIVTLPWGRLRRLLAPVLPLVGLIAVLASALDRTTLAGSDGLNVRIMVLGLVFGLLLAHSRFSGWFGVIYVALLSTYTALVTASDFLPSLLNLPRGSGWIIEMHTRLQFFIDQVGSWWSSYTIGDPIRERTILSFFVSLLLWNLLAWLGWWTQRRRQVLMAALPVGLYLTLIVGRSDLSLSYLQSFAFFVLITQVAMYFKALKLDWSERELDHPEGLELEWGFSAVMMILTAVLLARALPLLATPAGWRDIQRWLQREPATEVGQAGGIDPGRRTLDSVFSSTPELEVIGAPPATGEAIVMWVEISDPPPLPEGVPGSYNPPQHYWRSQIYTAYNGRGWEPLTPDTGAQLPDPGVAPADRYMLRQTYTLDITYIEALFAANQPYAIVGDEGEQPLVAQVIPAPVGTGPYSYTMLSWTLAASVGQLKTATGHYPDPVIDLYLQLPKELPSRVVDLAARLTRGLANEYDKAKRVEDYLRTNYPYDLSVSNPPPGRDVVDYFLFEAEGGFCSYHASAMTVMLRSLGIPARVVSGYAMGSYDFEREAYAVLEGDTHAWVEVYFPDYGWIEFEPTPNRREFAHNDLNPFNGNLDQTRIEHERGVRVAPLIIGGGLGIAVLAVFVAMLLWRRLNQDSHRRKEFGIPGHVYGEMRVILRTAGFRGQAALTPHEYMNRLSGILTQETNILQSLQHATELYTRARFSDRSLSDTELMGLWQGWRKNRIGWLYWAVRQKWLNQFVKLNRRSSVQDSTSE